MQNRETDLKELKLMHHGDSANLNWFSDGGAEVFKINNVYILFEIPQFGGSGHYAGTFAEGKESEILDLIYSWT